MIEIIAIDETEWKKTNHLFKAGEFTFKAYIDDQYSIGPHLPGIIVFGVSEFSFLNGYTFNDIKFNGLAFIRSKEYTGGD